MALVVDPGLSTTQSYSSLANALARAGFDLRGTTFAAIADATKQEKLLAQASIDIDGALLGSKRFNSVKADADQALEFPQTGGSVHPARIVLATQLLAFHLADREALGELGTPIADTSNVKEKTIGPLTTVRFSPAEMGHTDTTLLSRFPGHVSAYLEPFLGQARTPWGQGTARRKS